MKLPFPRAFLAALSTRFNNDFIVREKHAVWLQPGECPEEMGDNLRMRCAQICVYRWRQVDRGKSDAVRFEFECPTDATLFALSV